MINQDVNPSPPTRDRLVAAARRLFHEQGYEATGIATILREAGANSGSLYHFFSSKEELLLAVLDHYLEQLKPEVLDPADGQAADPIEKIFALLGLYRKGLIITECQLGCPIGNLALEVSDGHAPARARIEANFQSWCAGVRGWLEAAADRFPSGTDFQKLSQFILTVMEGGVMQARTRKSLAPFDDCVSSLRDYLDMLKDQRSREAIKGEGI